MEIMMKNEVVFLCTCKLFVSWCKTVFLFKCLKEKIKLKIPWKNLYTESTVAELDGLYLVAVPTISELQVFC